jgi:hypothetical protein
LQKLGKIRIRLDQSRKIIKGQPDAKAMTFVARSALVGKLNLTNQPTTQNNLKQFCCGGIIIG